MNIDRKMSTIGTPLGIMFLLHHKYSTYCARIMIEPLRSREYFI